MKGWKRGLIGALVIGIAVWPVMVVAGTPAKIIPTGKVSLLENGKPTQQIQSEMPLPEGVMMLCSGQCLMRADGMQLLAKDNAVFGVAEGAKKWEVTVKSGQIDFTLASSSKLVTFHTPHDVIDMQEAVFAASSNGVVRGSIMVTEKDTHFSITKGTARVSTENGVRVIQDGAEIQSTQAQLGPGAGGGGLLAGGVGTGLAIAGVATALIVGGAVVAGNSGGGGIGQESQSTPSFLK